MIIQCPTCQLRYDVAHRAPGTRARCRCGATFTVPAASAVSSTGVRCSGCGARNERRARNCKYCGAAMATASCPACFSLNPASYRHCSQCGGDLSAPARSLEKSPHDTPLTCPRCETGLDAKLLADTLVDQCSTCGGVWLDHDVLGRLLQDHTRQGPVRQRLLDMPAAPAREDTKKVVYLRCPECAVLMNRRNPAHRSGIIVDVCAAHGVWFDDRELAILMRLASSGATLNVSPRPLPPSAQGADGGAAGGNLAAAAAHGAGRRGAAPGRLDSRARRRRNRDSTDFDLDLDLGDLLRAVERFF